MRAAGVLASVFALLALYTSALPESSIPPADTHCGKCLRHWVQTDVLVNGELAVGYNIEHFYAKCLCPKPLPDVGKLRKDIVKFGEDVRSRRKVLDSLHAYHKTSKSHASSHKTSAPPAASHTTAPALEKRWMRNHIHTYEHYCLSCLTQFREAPEHPPGLVKRKHYPLRHQNPRNRDPYQAYRECYCPAPWPNAGEAQMWGLKPAIEMAWERDPKWDGENGRPYTPGLSNPTRSGIVLPTTWSSWFSPTPKHTPKPKPTHKPAKAAALEVREAATPQPTAPAELVAHETDLLGHHMVGSGAAIPTFAVVPNVLEKRKHPKQPDSDFTRAMDIIFEEHASVECITCLSNTEKWKLGDYGYMKVETFIEACKCPKFKKKLGDTADHKESGGKTLEKRALDPMPTKFKFRSPVSKECAKCLEIAERAMRERKVALKDVVEGISKPRVSDLCYCPQLIKGQFSFPVPSDKNIEKRDAQEGYAAPNAPSWDHPGQTEAQPYHGPAAQHNDWSWEQTPRQPGRQVQTQPWPSAHEQLREPVQRQPNYRPLPQVMKQPGYSPLTQVREQPNYSPLPQPTVQPIGSIPEAPQSPADKACTVCLDTTDWTRVMNWPAGGALQVCNCPKPWPTAGEWNEMVRIMREQLFPDNKPLSPEDKKDLDDVKKLLLETPAQRQDFPNVLPVSPVNGPQTSQPNPLLIPNGSLPPQRDYVPAPDGPPATQPHYVPVPHGRPVLRTRPAPAGNAPQGFHPNLVPAPSAPQVSPPGSQSVPDVSQILQPGSPLASKLSSQGSTHQSTALNEAQSLSKRDALPCSGFPKWMCWSGIRPEQVHKHPRDHKQKNKKHCTIHEMCKFHNDKKPLAERGLHRIYPLIHTLFKRSDSASTPRPTDHIEAMSSTLPDRTHLYGFEARKMDLHDQPSVTTTLGPLETLTALAADSKLYVDLIKFRAMTDNLHRYNQHNTATTLAPTATATPSMGEYHMNIDYVNSRAMKQILSRYNQRNTAATQTLTPKVPHLYIHPINPLGPRAPKRNHHRTSSSTTASVPATTFVEALVSTVSIKPMLPTTIPGVGAFSSYGLVTATTTIPVTTRSVRIIHPSSTVEEKVVPSAFGSRNSFWLSRFKTTEGPKVIDHGFDQIDKREPKHKLEIPDDWKDDPKPKHHKTREEKEAEKREKEEEKKTVKEIEDETQKDGHLWENNQLLQKRQPKHHKHHKDKEEDNKKKGKEQKVKDEEEKEKEEDKKAEEQEKEFERKEKEEDEKEAREDKDKDGKGDQGKFEMFDKREPKHHKDQKEREEEQKKKDEKRKKKEERKKQDAQDKKEEKEEKAWELEQDKKAEDEFKEYNRKKQEEHDKEEKEKDELWRKKKEEEKEKQLKEFNRKKKEEDERKAREDKAEHDKLKDDKLKDDKLKDDKLDHGKSQVFEKREPKHHKEEKEKTKPELKPKHRKSRKEKHMEKMMRQREQKQRVLEKQKLEPSGQQKPDEEEQEEKTTKGHKALRIIVRILGGLAWFLPIARPGSTSWTRLQRSLDDVERAAAARTSLPHTLGQTGVFGAGHADALRELRMAQIRLASAWGPTGREDIEGEAEARPSEAGGGEGDADADGEADLRAADARRKRDEVYFAAVKEGMLDVVAKLDEISRAMKGVEAEGREIWDDGTVGTASVDGETEVKGTA
ncbi:hypothetical protein ANO11243_008170 [Dothideomycetidae sp. 11243]|nr:hypothetical protein ANO11243_008170 [fungal sp. No.11243]